MQLFVIRVEGMNSEDYQSNRSIIQRNLEGKIPKQAWLEMDDFTFVHTEKLQNISNSNFTVADINGDFYFFNLNICLVYIIFFIM